MTARAAHGCRRQATQTRPRTPPEQALRRHRLVARLRRAPDLGSTGKPADWAWVFGGRARGYGSARTAAQQSQGPERQGHMPVPAGSTAHFIFVQARFTLGCLETALDVPAGAQPPAPLCPDPYRLRPTVKQHAGIRPHGPLPQITAPGNQAFLTLLTAAFFQDPHHNRAITVDLGGHKPGWPSLESSAQGTGAPRTVCSLTERP